MAWAGRRTLKKNLVTNLHHGQGCLSLDHVTESPIQLDFEHL